MISHRFPGLLIRLSWICFFLKGCSAYGPSTTAIPPTNTSVPPTSLSTSIASIPLLTPAPSIEIPKPPASITTSTTTAYPLTGSFIIGKGNCCQGGVDGDTIQAPVEFLAASPLGKVTSMRVKASYSTVCLTEAQMENVSWEPFGTSKTFPVLVAINWTSFNISAQFRDEFGNLSPVYCDNISVEGSPRIPLVDPTEWYPQIQCFSDSEVHPAPGEIMVGTPTTFSWPNKNNLPEGVFYKVNVYGVRDNYGALVASGQTRETSLTLQIPPENLGDIVWYVTLVDADGAFLDHGKCSSFPASLLTVDPPAGIKGIHFLYQP